MACPALEDQISPPNGHELSGGLAPPLLEVSMGSTFASGQTRWAGIGYERGQVNGRVQAVLRNMSSC